MAVVRKSVKIVKEGKTIKDKVAEYARIKNRIDKLQGQLLSLRQDLINELGTNFTGNVDNLKVSIRELTVHKIDTKQLKEKYPDIAQEVEKETKQLRVSVSTKWYTMIKQRDH